jgi:hypothetical protein
MRNDSMAFSEGNQSKGKVNRFDRASFSGQEKFTSMGAGSLGAKAHGLARISEVLENKIAPLFRPTIIIDIPLLTVIATDFFDSFISRNDLPDIAHTATNDEQIALAFQQADLPVELVADLRAFLERIRIPLAIRSSSLLEDAMGEPFAGVYATAMVPNNQPDLEDRLFSLSQAIKHIYASTYFKQAADYRCAASRESREEKMAVIIQEVVGSHHNGRFYPHISGVARSFNFYPLGLARPEDGVIDLALGLGKMIVENGISWPYSPTYPQVNPPYTTVRDLLKQSQKEFWAISLAEPPTGRQSGSVEHLKKFPLSDAERDGTLSLVASTYNAEDDRIMMGIRGPGPRIVDFAHIVKGEMIPLTLLLKHLLRECAELFGTMVTIEFALTWTGDVPPPGRFGFLQVRPMVVSNAHVHLRPEQLEGDKVLVASEAALGNGRRDDIRDIVYVKAETFDVARTKTIAADLEEINRKLLAQERPYLLIGFGRWGSSDPSAGIPINFAQISGAKIIVETTLPGIDFMLSQGSHFFHNITSFKILYFSVSHTGKHTIDWAWLNAQSLVTETVYVRHVRTARPLKIEVDGRSSRGVIYKWVRE